MDALSLSRKLPPIVKETGEIHAIVETPKGSRNKFGFIPGTLGEDGDPLDLLILTKTLAGQALLCGDRCGDASQPPS